MTLGSSRSDLSNPLLGPTRKRALGEDVAERLRQAILRGHFAPGQPLREEQLAQMLDVSRGPVREALARLEREGLVLIRHHRGATVARLTRSDVEEVYSLRLALERLAIQYAIRQARAEDFAAMESVIKAWSEAASRGITEQEAADLDVRFHDLIYRAARHQRLYDCWANLKSQVYVFLLSRNVANPDFRQTMVGGHGEILEALRIRDERRAIKLFDEHLRGAYLLVVRSYADEQEAEVGPPPFPAITELAPAGRASAVPARGGLQRVGGDQP